MLGSKNDFFFQEKKKLERKRSDMKAYLRIKGFSSKEVFHFGFIYDYFCEHPSHYDGETLVKDLVDLPNLSLAGLEHDYEYVYRKVWKNPIKKIKTDWRYGQRHEQLGRGYFIPYLRAICLIITTPIYYPIKLYKTLTA
jgi:hypothetical protein